MQAIAIERFGGPDELGVMDLTEPRLARDGLLTDGDQLRALAGPAETGELRVHLEQTLPLGEARRAHELIEDGHVRAS